VTLVNRIQHYAWGSPTAIPELLGIDNPNDEPCAELWLGAHPRAPSRVERDDGETLDRYIAANADALLGPAVAQRFAALPFLLKVLAAGQPLSIQCHPNLAQARAGFAAEEEAGVPRDAPHRNYRDANHKPELIVALTPFVALKGFREGPAIAALLRGHGVDALDAAVAAPAEAGDLQAAFGGLMQLDDRRRGEAIAQLRRGTAELDSAVARWVRRLLALHPDDAGVFAPLLLHVVELEPGQGLYLGARELHAYLEGTGIELMASSDNVLRGGLTPKHVDVAELLSVLRFEPAAPELLTAMPLTAAPPAAAPPADGAGVRRYATPAAEFELCVVDLERRASLALPSVAIALCTEGRGQVTAGERSLPIERGTSLLLPASCGRATFEGRGKVYLARVPLS
jgi:mannose-6-phosphate isomerase